MRRQGVRSDWGAVAVETVFVMIFVLVPLFTGVTEYGRALYTSIVLEEAAQEGANYMAFSGDSAANTETVVINSISFPTLTAANVGGAGGASEPSCTNVARDIAGGNGSEVTVTVEYELDFIILPSGLTLTQQAVAEGSTACP